MRLPRSDVDAFVGTVLATVGAFVSFAVLQSVAQTLDGTMLGRLAPAQTLGRLWVFFVLAPALLSLVGVGFPCLLRTTASVARGTIAREGVISLALVAVGLLSVAVEAAMQRSGIVALSGLCVLCLWRLSPRASALSRRLVFPLLVSASGALLGYAAYHYRLTAGLAASVAVAPTLFLVAFYATVIGVVIATLSAISRHRSTAVVALVWLATYTAWLAAGDRWGAASTFLASAALGLLAAWVWIWSRRRVDETPSFL